MHIVARTSEIEAGLEQLNLVLKKTFGTPNPCLWSFPGGGGHDELPTWYSRGKYGHLAIGFSPNRNWKSRVPVLIALEQATHGISPVVEINIPLKDRRRAFNRNRKINGCLTTINDGGEPWLSHRGTSFTTTPSRIPKRTIHSYFRKWLVPASDGNQVNDIIPIAPLAPLELPFGLVRFAEAVRDLKDSWATAEGKEEKMPHLSQWREDISFKDIISKVFTDSQSSYEYRHGPIQQALQGYLRNHLSADCRIALNDRIDLGILRHDRLVSIFEVKTSLGNQLYSAIGQLLVYRHQFTQDMKTPLFLVMPSLAATQEEFNETNNILHAIGVTLVVQRDDSFLLTDGRELREVLEPQWLRRPVG